MKGFNVSYKRYFPIAMGPDGKITEAEEIGIILHLEEGDKAQDVFDKAKAFVMKNANNPEKEK